MGVLLVSLRFILLSVLRILKEAFQAMDNVRSSLASIALTKSRTEALTCMLQIITCVVMEKGMESQRKTKISFGRTII